MPFTGSEEEEVVVVGWGGLYVIQVLPGSLRDSVAQASVSDPFQLDLHFAAHIPQHPWGQGFIKQNH